MRQNDDFTSAAIIGAQRLSNQDILDTELARARHALAYLKEKIGNDHMRELLKEDMLTMTLQEAKSSLPAVHLNHSDDASKPEGIDALLQQISGRAPCMRHPLQ